MREVVLATLTRLLPGRPRSSARPSRGPAQFMSYDYHSAQIYGFAYMALKRRMDVVGVEIPPAEELMPGPIDPRGFEEPVELPVDVAGGRPAPAGS